MTKRVAERTPEEKQQLIAQVNQMRKEGVTVKDACEKLGFSWTNYYNWTKKTGGKKGRRKKRPVLVTSLVPTTPEPQTLSDELVSQMQDASPNDRINMAAEFGGKMMASMLKSLLGGR